MPRKVDPNSDFDLERDTTEVGVATKKIEAKHLFATYFLDDPCKDKIDIINFWEEITGKIESFILCRETCHSTQAIHFHLFISASDRFKFNGVKRLIVPGFKHPNIRFVDRKHIDSCVAYCSKEDPNPLYKNYKPMKRKFNLNMDFDKFIETLAPMFDGKKINDKNVRDAAKELGVGSTVNLERFERMIKKHIKNTRNEHYVPAPETVQTAFKIPSVVRHWMEYDVENKAALIIRTAFPNTTYEMIKTFGPHILHNGSVDMDSFHPDIDNFDAKFIVLKTVSNFQGVRDPVTEHSLYITNLFEALGTFMYGNRLLCNLLPIIYIEDSKKTGSVWDIHGSWIGSCNLVEIINFDRDSYTSILNNKEFIASVNSENINTENMILFFFLFFDGDWFNFSRRTQRMSKRRRGRTRWEVTTVTRFCQTHRSRDYDIHNII